ncbi:MAG: adenosylcobinamide-GDP ribazoletransferase [bacterium]
MFSWWLAFAQALSLLTTLPVPSRQSIAGAACIPKDGPGSQAAHDGVSADHAGRDRALPLPSTTPWLGAACIRKESLGSQAAHDGVSADYTGRDRALPLPSTTPCPGGACIRKEGPEASGRMSRLVASGVRFFPLVGFIIGLILCGAEGGLSILFGPILRAALILAFNIAITGAIHLDGFIDTCDGLLSRQNREKTLAIMRDTHVGGLGAAALATLLVVKFAALVDISGPLRLWALLLFPVAGRLAMVGAICLFNYARPGAGMGRAYAKAGQRDLVIAFLLSLFVLFAVFWYIGPALGEIRTIVLSMFMSLGGSYLFAYRTAAKLEGLTGDVYGAVNELAELLFLILMASG